MRNRGIGRARMFVGGFILFGAAIAWLTGLTTPYGNETAEGTEHVRSSVVIYLRNIAVSTIALSALAAILLYPPRRPRMPKRDWAIGLLIALLVVSSLCRLVWLQTSVVN